MGFRTTSVPLGLSHREGSLVLLGMDECQTSAVTLCVDYGDAVIAQDAARLAGKLVTAYGLSPAGITTYAPPGEPPGFGRKAFEVAIDNIDADLFGRGATVRMLQLQMGPQE